MDRGFQYIDPVCFVRFKAQYLILYGNVLNGIISINFGFKASLESTSNIYFSSVGLCFLVVTVQSLSVSDSL